MTKQDSEDNIWDTFLQFSIKMTYVMGIDLQHFAKALLICTHNIMFLLRNEKKNIPELSLNTPA